MRKRSPWFWLLGAGGAIALVYLVRHAVAVYSFGRKNTLKLNRDPNMLVPAFADRLELLFKNLRMLGFDPCLHEGYRSPERAKQLAAEAAKGGKMASALSMHSYGAAVDIVSCSSGWSDPAFFKALGEEAKKLGLWWGGDWDGDNVKDANDWDENHVQAVPPSNKAQNEVRNAINVEAVVRKYLV